MPSSVQVPQQCIAPIRNKLPGLFQKDGYFGFKIQQNDGDYVLTSSSDSWNLLSEFADNSWKIVISGKPDNKFDLITIDEGGEVTLQGRYVLEEADDGTYNIRDRLLNRIVGYGVSPYHKKAVEEYLTKSTDRIFSVIKFDDNIRLVLNDNLLSKIRFYKNSIPPGDLYDKMSDTPIKTLFERYHFEFTRECIKLPQLGSGFSLLYNMAYEWVEIQHTSGEENRYIFGINDTRKLRWQNRFYFYFGQLKDGVLGDCTNNVRWEYDNKISTWLNTPENVLATMAVPNAQAMFDAHKDFWAGKIRVLSPIILNMMLLI